MSLLEVLERSRHDGAAAGQASPARPRRQLDGPGDGAEVGRLRRLLDLTPESAVSIVVVAAACLFVLVQLHPSRLLSTTTPAGGDMGAHVWQPAYLRDHLLTHFRLTGWAPSWYAGFPSLVFYFPLPNLLIVVLNAILPYQVAFKLVSVLGLVALPLSAWAFGRLARMPFPGPPCLAAATLPFLFGREFTIYGGNIASTLAGEFAFSISLATALVFLGLVARGLDTGRLRAWAAVALAVTGLCHLLPTVFAVIGAVVLTVMRADRRRWRWTVPALSVAACLAAFWSIPFLLRLPYATDMGYEKITEYAKNLFPPHLEWMYALAGAGAFVSILRRNRVGVFLTVMAALSALVFRTAPQARLWNARVLPFWFLCGYLLAGVALAEGGALLAESFSQGKLSTATRWTLLPIPVVVMLAALAWVGFPLRVLPFGHIDARTGDYSWLGIKSADKSFIPDWVYWNYSGYESDGKARRDEYFALVKTMGNLGHSSAGCGRAMWEYEPEENQFGTPLALMLLPYWTNSCIDSMEGLYFESSATTPYHFINAAELSLHPSNPVRGLNYPASPDIAEGVAHLQMLGVKYYMAITPETQAKADASSDLRLVATSGPWPVSYTTGTTSATKQRTWKIYQVARSDVVSPLLNQPVVMKGVAQGGKAWLTASESWYLDPSRRDVMYAASGPPSWARVAAAETDPPRTPLAPARISDIATRDDSVSFDTDTIGVPVLVKVSYFPNWHVAGAKGPWRVTPNLMVVIPTSHHVRLQYGYTPVDVLGILLSLLGVAGVVWLARSKPVRYRQPRHAEAHAPRHAGDAGDAGDEAAAGAPDQVVDTTPVPYARLEAALVGAEWQRGDASKERDRAELDLWLGFPAGLDLARYHVVDYGASQYRDRARADPAPSEPTGADQDVPKPAVDASGKVSAHMPGLDAIFKAYDIRGTVPDQLNPELARSIGAAFAGFCASPTIVVARDMRESGVELCRAFTEGVTRAGIDVIDIGLASTDELYFTSGKFDAPGAMFTASHNPARYNGIKLCLAGARPVGEDTGLAVIKAAAAAMAAAAAAAAPAAVMAPPADRQGSVSTRDTLEDFAAHVRSFVDTGVLRPLKVVADTANGMGGLVVPRVFAGLPFKLDLLYGELDGSFPNHPADPIQAANLVDLQARVLETGADVGLAFDGDADRCFLVDDKAQPVSGSTTTAIVASAMLEKHPGASILYNLICSKSVPEIIKEKGGIPIRTRVGHSFIKTVMAETGAIFGGEHSAHYYFRDNYRADSGSIAALVVLELLSRAQLPLSEVRKPFERYADSGEINTEVPDPRAVVERVAALFAPDRHPEASQDRTDGLTVDMGDWWFNLRPSNTEPLLRLNLEAATPAECERHTSDVLAIVKES